MKAPKLQVDLLTERDGYGFGHNWTLAVKKGNKTKNFWLGQDAKVCSRMLGISGRELAEQIGSNDMGIYQTRKAICDVILKAIGVTKENEDSLFELESWGLAVQ